ncbi:MAG: dipeptidase [Armatimonadota bacterium]|nr:dipeptidase [Armatimonadota bacterium]MDR5703427.1 dipeptidase [Armatimonadota bacterium]MDR7434431.1 dipeptidase [Armatimonadota bacterium]
MDVIDTYVENQQQRFLEDLIAWLRIPSISTLPSHRPHIEEAARWLRDHLHALGFQAEIIPTEGHPLVYAEHGKDQGKPTVLMYGHYDVQPPDPLEKWRTPPFEPVIEEGYVYARGASDDKGQALIPIHATETLLRTSGALPVHVKVLVEGEEEIGSPNIGSSLRAHREMLKADVALVCDTAMFAKDLPTLVTGLRGLLYTEVEVEGASRDLHSGQYGGAAPNPLNALAKILSGLVNRKGRVTIPGFYTRVKPPAPEERRMWASLPFREDAYLQELGVDAAPGEEGFTVLERRWVRPTLDVHGISGGFTGEGIKTVIPARATAKISMRLVPDQDPEEIARRFARKVHRLAPPGVRVQVRVLASGRPVVVDPAHPALRAAARALEETFRRPPVLIREGGSIPVVSHFQEILGIPSVLMGFGLPDDNLHAPNERFSLANFYSGIRAVARFLLHLAEVLPR